MRARLLEATVDCLVEQRLQPYVDHAGLRAGRGVSRGAQLHHFPTKNDLVVAAVEHLTEVRGADLAAAAERLPTGKRRTRAVLQMLADHFTGPVFTAALELWVAARTDETLLAAVEPLEQRVGRETHRLTVELLGADESRPGVRELVQATLDLVRGLGLANTISDDARRRTRILDRWAITLDAALAAAGRPREGRERRARPDPRRPQVRGRPALEHRRPASTRTAGGPRPRRPGWDVATQVAHLLWTDEVAVLAATDKAAWDDVVVARDGGPGRVSSTPAPARSRALAPDSAARAVGRRARGRWLSTLREYPAGERMPWFGPPMSPASMATARFMETWAHALDVYDALGVTRAHRPHPPRRPPRRAHPQLRVRRPTASSRRPRSSGSS